MSENKYKLRKNKENNMFEVFEINTNQILFVHKDYKIASMKYRFLCDNGSFDGWTPDFFMKKST